MIYQKFQSTSWKAFLLALYLLVGSCLQLEATPKAQTPVLSHKDLKALKGSHTLAICAMFQNEAPYIKEWIEYHRLVGVEHFYLFNNLSTDNFKAILEPYMKAGIVDLYDWPYPSGSLQEYLKVQYRAYNTMISLTRTKVKWLAIIDLDEFIVPHEGNDLKKILKNYEKYGAVCINWQCFGTSDVNVIPANKLMIETLLRRAPVDFPRNLCVKSIIRPQAVERCLDSHSMKFYPGFYQVTTNKKSFIGMYSPSVLVDKIQINHYWTRDEHHYLNVKLPRLDKWSPNNARHDWSTTIKKFNEETDSKILRFVPALRAKMGL